MGKIWFIAGAAVGFVLGSKAGREQYEKLRRRAADVWQGDRVQSAASTAAEAAKKNVPGVGGVVGAAKSKLDDAAEGAARSDAAGGEAIDAAI